MINHIQTLLLNESASVIQATLPESTYGYIAPEYQAIALPKNTEPVYALLFSAADNLGAKLHLVQQLLPLFGSPEFSEYASFFDSRVVGKPTPPKSIFDFYSTTDGSVAFPIQVVNSKDTPLTFTLSGNSLIDEKLASLYRVFGETTETVKKFTALLFAIVFQLEAVRMKVEA